MGKNGLNCGLMRRAHQIIITLELRFYHRTDNNGGIQDRADTGGQCDTAQPLGETCARFLLEDI